MTFSESAIPTTTPATWQFNVWHVRRPEGLRATGSVVYSDAAEEVQELARRAGLDVREYANDRSAIDRDGALPVETSIRISQAEDSEALREVISGIKELYGIDLSQEPLIANEQREFFRVRKSREFTASQIEEARFLMVQASRFMIGTLADRTDEELENLILAVMNDSRQQANVKFGCVAPFWAHWDRSVAQRGA